jgi:hypothetical protein
MHMKKMDHKQHFIILFASSFFFCIFNFFEWILSLVKIWSSYQIDLNYIKVNIVLQIQVCATILNPFLNIFIELLVLKNSMLILRKTLPYIYN